MMNLLQMRPRRLFEHRLEADGRVRVLVPRFRARWMAWYLRLLRRPCAELRLDELGSTAWLLFDGRHTVAEVAAALEERFGPAATPAADRLAIFLRQLEGGRLVRLEG
jgi:hypothetical protein